MASFMEDIWNSVFAAGPTPTLLVATNATFAALQLLLLSMLLVTYSIHFVILSCISGGLWYAINWFAGEIMAEQARQEQQAQASREKSLDPGSETETEAGPEPALISSAPTSSTQQSSSLLRPDISRSEDEIRKRRSLGDSSGYVSTDSEWEKISEDEDKKK